MQSVRCSSTALRVARPKVSHVRSKLQHFIETGEIMRMTPFQAERKRTREREKAQRAARFNGLSSQKALLMLQTKYDSHALQDKTGNVIQLSKLKPLDLAVDLLKLRSVFEALIKIKQVSRERPNERLLLHLLGSSAEQLKDPFVVTRDVVKLLNRDEDTARALMLCQMAREKGVVGMNAILQWLLERGKVDLAQKSLVDRVKWGIPCNEQTYVHYFSGIAQCHKWGEVPDALAAKCVKQLEKSDASVEVFNACLSVLVKNYTNNQQQAWLLFEKLDTLALNPDCQLFTIFLQGCKKYYEEQVRDVKAKQMSRNERTKQLVELQALLVGTAKMVLNKVTSAATPPEPPSKQEAKEHPELLETYRKKCKKVLVDIDAVFATTFVSCFVNNHAGTGVSSSLGSHYVYLQQGLAYLRAWCPEIEQMMQFVESKGRSTLSTEIKRSTDERIRSSKLAVPQLEAVSNPMVAFPPPAFSNNKTRATFSGRRKRLIDFGRPLFADVHKLKMHKNFVNSKGKFGKKLTKDVLLERTDGINRFLLLLALDALIKMGQHRDFYLAMWYAFSKWGGIEVDRSNLGTLGEALPKEAYPNPATKSSGVPTSHKENIIDVMLVENFIYKMDENFTQAEAPARCAAELVAGLVSKSSLKPREKTFDAIFSMLFRNIHQYNDRNRQEGIEKFRKLSLPNNTPKKSLTFEQLGNLLDPLAVMVSSIMAQGNIPNRFVTSVNALLQNILVPTWTILENEVLTVHKKILKAAILLYRPRDIVDPRDNVTRIYTLDSVSFVYKKLKEDKNLGASDRKLMLKLRSLLQTDLKLEDAAERFESLTLSIYALL